MIKLLRFLFRPLMKKMTHMQRIAFANSILKHTSWYKNYRCDEVILYQKGNNPVAITIPSLDFIRLLEFGMVHEPHAMTREESLNYFVPKKCDSFMITNRSIFPTDRTYRNDWRLKDGKPYFPISFNHISTMQVKTTHPLILTHNLNCEVIIENTTYKVYNNEIVFPNHNTLEELKFHLEMTS